MREFDPSILTADPQQQQQQPVDGSTSTSDAARTNENAAPIDESAADVDSDPFASYFTDWDPTLPPKVLITTSPKAKKMTYNFCEELVDIFPGSEFIRRKKGRGFEMGRIAGWAADRGYSKMIVVNEDVKKPSKCTLFFILLIYSELASLACGGHSRCCYNNTFAIWSYGLL
jgi:ribosome production factor 1